jgi:hypothetical protein
MPNTGNFSVDIDALEKGGVHIKDMATLAASIYGELFAVTSKYGRTLGGNGDVGKSFETNYYPAEEGSLGFLRDLKDLVDTHGSKTIELGGFFGDVDDTAVTEAGGTGHRH